MIRTVAIGRYNLFADDTNVTGQKLLGNGLNYESHIREEICRYLKNGGVFFDIGANAGIHSISAIDAGASQVYAFEPSPANVSLFARSIVENGLQDQITLFPFALAHENCLLRHNRDTSNTTFKLVNGTSTDDCPEWSAALSIECLRLPQPDLVKIDVEGFELLVLRGMERSLAGRRAAIVFEFCPEVCHRSGTDAEGLLNWLLSKNYTLTMLDYMPGTRRVCRTAEGVMEHLRNTSQTITDIIAEP